MRNENDLNLPHLVIVWSPVLKKFVARSNGKLVGTVDEHSLKTAAADVDPTEAEAKAGLATMNASGTARRWTRDELQDFVNKKYPLTGNDKLDAAIIEKMREGCDYVTALRAVTAANPQLWREHQQSNTAVLSE